MQLNFTLVVILEIHPMVIINPLLIAQIIHRTFLLGNFKHLETFSYLYIKMLSELRI